MILFNLFNFPPARAVNMAGDTTMTQPPTRTRGRNGKELIKKVVIVVNQVVMVV